MDLNYVMREAKAFARDHIISALDIGDREFQILLEKTLKQLSVYYPHITNHFVIIKRDRIPGSNNRFYINLEEPYEECTVLKCYNVIDFGGVTMYGDAMFKDYFAHQALTDMSSYLVPSMTLQFMPPNEITLYPYNYTWHQTVGRFTIKIGITHKKDLSTLPPQVIMNEFMELFKVNIAETILTFRKYFAQLQTTSGEINLDLQIFEDYYSKKQDVMDKLESKMLKHDNSPRIYVY